MSKSCERNCGNSSGRVAPGLKRREPCEPLGSRVQASAAMTTIRVRHDLPIYKERTQ